MYRHKLHFSVFTSSLAVTVSPSTTGSTVANSTRHKALFDLLKLFSEKPNNTTELKKKMTGSRVATSTNYIQYYKC